MERDEQDALTMEGQGPEKPTGPPRGNPPRHEEHNNETNMQKLLNQAMPGEGAMRTLRRGDVIEGIVAHIGEDEILVDIGFKTEGVIPAQELANQRPGMQLAEGDHVLVYVVNPENKEGNVILSLAKAQLERDWQEAQEKAERGEILELEVIGYNRGGLIVRCGEIRGFVPASQVFDLRGAAPAEQPDQHRQQMVGKKLRLKIIEVDRSKNRLILSETAAARGWRSEQKDRLLSQLQKGEVRRGRVSGLADFGAFVDLGGADGLIHVSELSWQPISHPSEVVKVGDEVEVYVMDVDREKKRIALSLKRMQPEPWEVVSATYHVGQLVPVTITKLTTFGAFARLQDGVEGLIHISELSEERISHPRTVVNVGDEVMARIVRIEPERRRLGLSLRQARETTEQEPVEERKTPSSNTSTEVAPEASAHRDQG